MVSYMSLLRPPMLIGLVDIDKHIFVLSAKHLRKVANTQPLKTQIKSYGFPGANVTTDADWANFLAENVKLPFHPCCEFSSKIPTVD